MVIIYSSGSVTCNRNSLEFSITVTVLHCKAYRLGSRSVEIARVFEKKLRCQYEGGATGFGDGSGKDETS